MQRYSTPRLTSGDEKSKQQNQNHESTCLWMQLSWDQMNYIGRVACFAPFPRRRHILYMSCFNSFIWFFPRWSVTMISISSFRINLHKKLWLQSLRPCDLFYQHSETGEEAVVHSQRPIDLVLWLTEVRRGRPRCGRRPAHRCPWASVRGRRRDGCSVDGHDGRVVPPRRRRPRREYEVSFTCTRQQPLPVCHADLSTTLTWRTADVA